MVPDASPPIMSCPLAQAQHKTSLAMENVASTAPVATYHTLSVSSAEAERTRCPSGLIATPVTACKWPSSVRSSPPLSKSHNLSVLSADADTAMCPFTATALTACEWPRRARNSRPLSESHTLRVLSHEAETAQLPSWHSAHALTRFE